MMTGISDLTAAQLSEAAYKWPPVAVGDWQALPQYSGQDASGNNQFISFYNAQSGQVVMTFKGSDNPSNWESDLANAGGSAWESIRDSAQAAYQAIKNDPSLSNAEIMTDGHSLGGGMAQTMALENNLSGYGQNSLPISATAIANDPALGNNFNNQLVNWDASPNKFNEVNTAGDPATNFYSATQGLYGTTYLSTPSSTTTLDNPWSLGEVAGSLLSSASLVVGAVVSAFSAFESHSINTVISLLNSPPVTTTNPNGSVTTQYGDSSTSTTTVNPVDGSSTVYAAYSNGSTSVINYNANGNPTSVSTRTYNPVDGTSSTATADEVTGITTSNNYDANNQLISSSTVNTITNSGSTQNYTNGVLTSQTDFNPTSATKTNYNPATQLPTDTTTVNSDNSSTTKNFNEFGDLVNTTSTSSTGAVTTTTIDPSTGDQVTTSPNGSVTNIIHSADGVTQSTLNGDGSSQVQFTDANGNVSFASNVNADGSGSSVNYNPDGSGYTTNFQANGAADITNFNSDGSLANTTNIGVDGSQTVTNYGSGNVVTSTKTIAADGSSSTTTYVNNGDGKVVTTVNSDGSSTQTTYSSSGALINSTSNSADGSSSTTTFDATTGNYNVNVNNADGSSAQSVLDVNGHLLSQKITNADGTVTTTSYAADGTVLSNISVGKNGIKSGESFTFYSDGTMASDTVYSGDGSSNSTTYYSTGVMASQSHTNPDGSGNSTTYDVNGVEVTSGSWLASGANFINTAVNSTNSDGSQTVTTYNAGGNISSITVTDSNGATLTKYYYANGNLESLTASAPNGFNSIYGLINITASSLLCNASSVYGGAAAIVFVDGTAAISAPSQYGLINNYGLSTSYQIAYAPNGSISSLSITFNNGVQDNILYNSSGGLASETLTGPNGLRSVAVFNLNGTPKSVTSYYPDGSHDYRTYYSDNIVSSFTTYYADGSVLAEQYFANGFQSSSSWTGRPDGTSIYYVGDPDGSYTQTTYSADASYVVFAKNTRGNISESTTYYNASGVKLSDNWQSFYGTYGSDTFNADGSSSGTTTDSSRLSISSYTNDGQGDIKTTYYGSQGQLGDVWSSANGSSGTDGFNLDGSSYGSVRLASGSSYSYSNDGQGDIAYRYNFNGSGSIEIPKTANTKGRLVFAPGIGLSNLTVSAAIGSDGGPALVIQTGNGDTLSIDGGLDGSINQFEFANGNTMSLDQLMSYANTTPVTVAGADGSLIFDANGYGSLVGSSGNDTIYAWNGNDTLISGSGVSTLIGESGNDTFIVNNSADIISANYTGNIVESSVSYAMDANAPDVQTLTLTGSGNLIGIGNNAGDVIIANSGNDTLIGGTGADKLVAGSGTDSIFMGSGTSTVQVNPLTAGSDLIGGNGSADRVLNAYYQAQGIANWQVSYQYGGTMMYTVGPAASTSATGGTSSAGPVYYDAQGISQWLVQSGNGWLANSLDEALTYGIIASVEVPPLSVLAIVNGSSIQPSSYYATSNIPDVVLPSANDFQGLASYYAQGILPQHTVAFGAGISPSDIHLSWGQTVGSISGLSTAPQSTYTTLDISWGTNNQSIQVMMPHFNDPLGSGTSQFTFTNADGSTTTLSMAQMITMAPPAPSFDPININKVYGTTGDEILTGFSGIANMIYAGSGNDKLIGGSSNDTLCGGVGNDTLVAGTGAVAGMGGDGTMIGGSGSDTFMFNLGDGQRQTVWDTNEIFGGFGLVQQPISKNFIDTIQFGSGITAGDTRFQLQGEDLLVSYGTQGDSFRIIDFVLAFTETGSNSIGQFQYADGSTGSLSRNGYGSMLEVNYDASGNVINSTTFSYVGGNVTMQTVDAAGNLIGSGNSSVNVNTGIATSTGESFNQDGSYSTYTNDGHGNADTKNFSANGILVSEILLTTIGSTTNYYDANGNLVRDSWMNFFGTHGSDTFGTDGSKIGTGYNPDGTYYTFTQDASGNNYAELDYAATGILTGSYTYTSDGLGNYSDAYYDATGNKLSDDWGKSDGTYGSDAFNADGSSSGTAYNPDNSYSSYTDDGLGDVTTTYFDLNGVKTSDNWAKADGSSGSDTYALDGSHTSYSITAAGTATDSTYDTTGRLTSDNWVKADGSSGSDTYALDGSHTGYSITAAGTATDSTYDTTGRLTSDNWVKADGSSGSDTYALDGSHTGYSITAAGTATDRYYDTTGRLTSDDWVKADGSSGSDTYALDGSHTGYSITAAGTSTDSYYDTTGRLTNDDWVKADGSSGSDTYALDGSHTSYSLDASGTSTDGNYDTTGHITSDYWVKADGTQGGDTYTYNADGSFLQQWTKSDGSLGSISFDSTGTATGDSIVNADGSQQADAGGNHLLMGSTANDTLAAASGNDILIGAAGTANVTTGSGTNLIAFNAGGGQEVVSDAAGQNNTVSLGGTFAFSDLALQKSGNDLVLDVGTSDSITFKNWYAGAQNIVNLQVIETAMTDFNPGSTDALRNSNVENFDFKSLVVAFDQAQAANPGLNAWSVTNDLLNAHLASSDTAALGGDLAYIYGSQGSLTGMNVVAAENTLSNTQFAAAPQTLNPWPTLNTGTAQIR